MVCPRNNLRFRFRRLQGQPSIGTTRIAGRGPVGHGQRCVKPLRGHTTSPLPTNERPVPPSAGPAARRPAVGVLRRLLPLCLRDPLRTQGRERGPRCARPPPPPLNPTPTPEPPRPPEGRRAVRGDRPAARRTRFLTGRGRGRARPGPSTTADRPSSPCPHAPRLHRDP